MFRFLNGPFAGLALASVLRRAKVEGVTQERLDRYYERRAQNYNLTDYLYLGQFPRVEMRKRVVALSGMKAGDVVLDFACGAGANFPYIMEQIGPTGKLIATDYSQHMLDAAQKVIDEHGWKNVELVQADAAQMAFDQQFDVVMCTLGLAVIPGWQEAMQRGWEHLRPGGMFAIGDLSESRRWYTRPFSFLNDLIDTAIIADSSRRPWEWMQQAGDSYRREEIFHGYFYAAVVRKPVKVAVNGRE